MVEVFLCSEHGIFVKDLRESGFNELRIKVGQVTHIITEQNLDSVITEDNLCPTCKKEMKVVHVLAKL